MLFANRHHYQHTGTRETVPMHIWLNTVEVETIRIVGTSIDGVGFTGEWLRAEAQHARLVRAYRADEPVWMAIDEMVLRARVARIASAEDRDRAVIARAARDASRVR